MSEKTTIYDIAKKLNITAATVSRALNNNPRISESTKALVLKTAAELNYKQNKLAKALKSGKTFNVGVIVPIINRSFFSSIIRGIEEELEPMGYHIIICQTHEDEQKEIDIVNTLLNAQVDGILMSIAKGTETQEHFKTILKKNTPLVFFDRKKDVEGVSTVTINDFEGAYKATEHLIQQGCTKIAHIAGDWALEIYQHRYQGYRKALEDYQIPFDKRYLIHTKSDIEAGEKAVAKLLALDKIPDAIFSSSDYVALGAIKAVKAAGILVPDDFLVVGFSNEPFTKFMELSMSTVDQSPLEMGKMAAKVFLEQVDTTAEKIEKKVVLSPELIIRKSSVKT